MCASSGDLAKMRHPKDFELKSTLEFCFRNSDTIAIKYDKIKLKLPTMAAFYWEKWTKTLSLMIFSRQIR